MSDPHDASVGAIERNFVALGLGDVLSRAVLFVASIYLARTLGVELYGIVALAATLRLYAVLVGDVGISILGSREVAEDPERARALAPALLTP